MSLNMSFIDFAERKHDETWREMIGGLRWEATISEVRVLIKHGLSLDQFVNETRCQHLPG